MKKITIAIASPGDVPEEREAVPKVFNRWNDANPKLAFLHPKMWENATPELGGHPQHILNRKLIDDSDLLVAILHSKLGTPTPSASSGTVEEIREFITKKGPRRVMLFFCKRSLPVDIDPAELTRLNEFKASMRQQGLYAEYTTVDEFREQLYRHVDVKAHEFLADELPLPPVPQLTDISVHEKVLPADHRLHTLIDFGTNLDAIANGFNLRMEEFMAIDGCSNDKYYMLGAHVYTSAARCLDRFLTYSAAEIAQQDIRVLETLSMRLKNLANNIPKPGSDFRVYWSEGDEIAKAIVTHAAHISRCKK
jgi:hypothetical protein